MTRSRLIISGTIMFLMVVSAMLISCSDDDNIISPKESWVYRSLGEGIDGDVNTLQEFDGKLYAGGNFLIAGGDTAKYIAAWDGTEWSPVGLGMSWPVYAFTIYDNKLIVGGSFGSAGGIQVNKVAAYDGSSWSSLASGLQGDYVVRDLCVLRDTLFAVGSEGINLNAELLIAAWDGSTWSIIESGIPGNAKAACTYNSNLLVGGEYLDGSNKDGFVKIRSGGVWYDYDSTTVTNLVNDLIYCNDKLYVAGSGDYPIKDFSLSWQNIGSDQFASGSFMATVRTLCEFDNNLIAGGNFITVGSNTTNHLASWNGTTWSPLGSGITDGDWVYCLTAWQNKLYVAGAFSEAGGETANNITVLSFE